MTEIQSVFADKRQHTPVINSQVGSWLTQVYLENCH